MNMKAWTRKNMGAIQVLSKSPVNFDLIQTGDKVAPLHQPFRTYLVKHKDTAIILEAGNVLELFTPERFNKRRLHRWENLCP